MTSSCTLEVSEDGCLSLTGPLTFESTPSIYREAQSLFSGAGGILRVDLGGITAADSAGLALLLEWQAMQQSASQTMEIQNAPAGLMSLARLCEADEVMKLSGRTEHR